jgi:hypothetical protein
MHDSRYKHGNNWKQQQMNGVSSAVRSEVL